MTTAGSRGSLGLMQAQDVVSSSQIFTKALMAKHGLSKDFSITVLNALWSNPVKVNSAIPILEIRRRRLGWVEKQTDLSWNSISQTRLHPPSLCGLHKILILSKSVYLPAKMGLVY